MNNGISGYTAPAAPTGRMSPPHIASEYSIVASLVLLTYELIINCKFELLCIWRLPMDRVKCVYLFARYTAIPIQLAHVILSRRHLSGGPATLQFCRVWFGSLFLMGGLLLLALDFILCLQVCVMYTWNRRAIIPMIIALCIQEGLTVVCVLNSYMRDMYDGECNSRGEIDMPMYLSLAIAVVSNHAVMFGLTSAKRKLGAGQVSVVNRVVRDGALMFIIMFVLCTSVVSYTLTSHVVQPHLVLIWPQTICSLAICRIVRNILTLKVENRELENMNNSTFSIQLSSIVNLDGLISQEEI